MTEVNNVDDVDDSEEAFITPVKIQNNESRKSLNRGTSYKDRISSVNSSEDQLLEYFFESANPIQDYSFHWIEKYQNLKRVSNPIEIDCSLDFTEPTRDLTCEYELLKLITDDQIHKDSLISLPKSMKKFNRYSDILPCNLFEFIY